MSERDYDIFVTVHTIYGDLDVEFNMPSNSTIDEIENEAKDEVVEAIKRGRVTIDNMSCTSIKKQKK
jgi:hypothetical protein